MSLLIDILARHSPFPLNEVVLFGETLSLSFADLLLFELGVVEVFFSNTIDLMLSLIFLSTNLFDCGHLLVLVVIVIDMHLTPLFLLPHAHSFLISCPFGLLLLLISLFLKHLVVVFSLQVLEFIGFLSCLVDLLNRSVLFILKHSYSVAKQFNVPLEL